MVITLKDAHDFILIDRSEKTDSIATIIRMVIMGRFRQLYELLGGGIADAGSFSIKMHKRL